jgi:hypothetical protein
MGLFATLRKNGTERNDIQHNDTVFAVIMLSFVKLSVTIT